MDNQITKISVVNIQSEFNKNNKNVSDIDSNNKKEDSLIDTVNNSKILYFFNTSIIIIFFIVLLVVTILYNNNLDKYFWINQFIKYISVCIIQICMALFIYFKNIRVNYTRKVIHISYFIIPQLLDIILIKYKKNRYTELWNIWIILCLLILISEPIRKRIKIIDFMFKTVDRPEDKPYTLFWFSTQIIVTLMVIIPFSIFFSDINKIGFVFIPILINGLADGLAEPIGIKFGKHKYKTRACFSNREYERSYEGSLCVFIVSLTIIVSYYDYMSLNQYIFNIFTIPIVTTLTEAYAPHTWDSPSIFLVVCSLLTLSHYL